MHFQPAQSQARGNYSQSFRNLLRDTDPVHSSFTLENKYSKNTCTLHEK